MVVRLLRHNRNMIRRAQAQVSDCAHALAAAMNGQYDDKNNDGVQVIDSRYGYPLGIMTIPLSAMLLSGPMAYPVAEIP